VSFFDELKRRNVVRVGIAFAITAWLIAQIAGLAADSFGAPDWVMKMIITMLVLGAPIALVMAWAYELTPDGLRRESDIEPGRSSAQANASKLDRTITIALVLAVVYFSYDKFVLDPRRDAALIETTSKQAAVAVPQAVPLEAESTPLEQTPSIAVLPFVNMSDDADNEYFSEGLSEELLNLLVRIPKLKVAARTSSFSYKGKDTKIAQIGEELNVAHVLEGSVRKSGNRVRITAQLIKADDGFNLWSQTYDRTLDDIFVTQDEIAAAVVDALKITLLGALPEHQKTDPEVYALYLQGTYFANQRTEENLEKAQLAFQQALAIDPAYAPAWVGIARAYSYQSTSGYKPLDEGLSLAREAVNKALALDTSSAPAWAQLAYSKRLGLDWHGAQAAIDQAIQLEPKNVTVLGVASALATTLGQLSVATVLLEQAVALDPLNLPLLKSLGRIYTMTGQYDEAIVAINRLLTLSPDYPAVHITLSRPYLFKGDPERALIEAEKSSNEIFIISRKAKIHFTLGNEEQSQHFTREFLARFSKQLPGPMASIYAWRGENDLAFEWFEKALEQNEFRLSNFLGNEWNRGLESDPRYPGFVEKLGLLEAWMAMPPEYHGSKRGQK